MADTVVDVAHHARQPHARAPAEGNAQHLATMVVAMRQQHEGQHAGIADLEDHDRRRAGEFAQHRLFAHHDLLRRRLGRTGRRGAGRLLDPVRYLLDDGQRGAKAFELVFERVGQVGRLRGPRRDRGNGHRQKSRDEQRQQRHRGCGGGCRRHVGLFELLGHRRQHQRQDDRRGRGNEEVARQVADDAHGAHGEDDQRPANCRAALHMDDGIVHPVGVHDCFFIGDGVGGQDVHPSPPRVVTTQPLAQRLHLAPKPEIAFLSVARGVCRELAAHPTLAPHMPAPHTPTYANTVPGHGAPSLRYGLARPLFARPPRQLSRRIGGQAVRFRPLQSDLLRLRGNAGRQAAGLRAAQEAARQAGRRRRTRSIASSA